MTSNLQDNIRCRLFSSQSDHSVFWCTHVISFHAACSAEAKEHAWLLTYPNHYYGP